MTNSPAATIGQDRDNPGGLAREAPSLEVLDLESGGVHRRGGRRSERIGGDFGGGVASPQRRRPGRRGGRGTEEYGTGGDAMPWRRGSRGWGRRSRRRRRRHRRRGGRAGFGVGVSIAHAAAPKQGGEHGWLGRGTHLQGDAAVVDDQREAEEPATALLGGGEAGDLGDVVSGPNSRRTPSSTPAGDDARSRRPCLQTSLHSVERSAHLAGAERARDRLLLESRSSRGVASGLGDERHNVAVVAGRSVSLVQPQVSSQGPRPVRSASASGRPLEVGGQGGQLRDLGVGPAILASTAAEPVLDVLAPAAVPRGRQLCDLVQLQPSCLARAMNRSRSTKRRRRAGSPRRCGPVGATSPMSS